MESMQLQNIEITINNAYSNLVYRDFTSADYDLFMLLVSSFMDVHDSGSVQEFSYSELISYCKFTHIRTHERVNVFLNAFIEKMKCIELNSKTISLLRLSMNEEEMCLRCSVGEDFFDYTSTTNGFIRFGLKDFMGIKKICQASIYAS